MSASHKPRCPYFGSCGGCQLQHLPYEKQLRLKQDKVRERVENEGVEVEVKPMLGMADPWFYRNKVQFPIREQNGRLQVGYFKARTHEVVNIKECYIQNPYLTEIAQIAREIFEKRGLSAYDEKTGQGLLRHFIGRSSSQTAELLLGIVVNAKGLPAGFTVADEIKKQERKMRRLAARHEDYPALTEKPRIVGVVQNINQTRGNVILGGKNTTLLGIPFLREKLGGFTFRVQLASFLQVNPLQAERLYDLVVKYAELTEGETAVDAYAGIGGIAFWLARRGGSVMGLEEREAAAKDAQENIRLNKLANLKMVPGLVEKVFPKRADVVVLDPPRGGCSGTALQLTVKANPRRIVYVSCNPETLARDLRILAGSGYQTEVIQPLDMFPQTIQVEAVAKLSRG